jgi:hypothetical protein
LVAASLGLIAAAGVAGAADPVAERAPAAVQAVVDCRKIADDTQRLACFDAAVATMATAVTNGDLVSLDRQQRTAVRRQAFGLRLPSLSLLDNGKPLDDVQETLSSARQDADGKWIFVMEGGEIWRQIDDGQIYPEPHAGSLVVIRRASLGSFMLSVDKQAGVRAHRDN